MRTKELNSVFTNIDGIYGFDIAPYSGLVYAKDNSSTLSKMYVIRFLSKNKNTNHAVMSCNEKSILMFETQEKAMSFCKKYQDLLFHDYKVVKTND
jgi:hypothetical protein